MDAHARALGVLELRCRFARGRGDRGGERVAQRGIQAGDGRVVERAGDREGRQLRDVEDLVGVGIADATDRALVAEQALELDPLSGKDRREALEGEVVGEWVRAERLDAGDVGDRVDDVCREPLACPGLGEVEARAVVQPDTKGDRRLARANHRLWQGIGPPQPTGAGQMEDQVRSATVDVDELAMTSDARDGRADEGLRRWVEGLEDADRAEVDPRDGQAVQSRAQEVDKGLHLGQFRHRRRPPRRRAAGRPRRPSGRHPRRRPDGHPHRPRLAGRG